LLGGPERKLDHFFIIEKVSQESGNFLGTSFSIQLNVILTNIFRTEEENATRQFTEFLQHFHFYGQNFASRRNNADLQKNRRRPRVTTIFEDFFVPNIYERIEGCFNSNAAGGKSRQEVSRPVCLSCIRALLSCTKLYRKVYDFSNVKRLCRSGPATPDSILSIL
jgi:hypothetical protein